MANVEASWLQIYNKKKLYQIKELVSGGGRTRQQHKPLVQSDTSLLHLGLAKLQCSRNINTFMTNKPKEGLKHENFARTYAGSPVHIHMTTWSPQYEYICLNRNTKKSLESVISFHKSQSFFDQQYLVMNQK